MTKQVLIGVVWFATAACGGADTAGATQALTAICIDDPAAAPAGAWMCGEDRVVECTTPRGTRGPALYLVDPSCGELTVSDPGPFPLGTRVIDVRDTTAVLGQLPRDRLVCTSTLTIVDTTPPRVSDRGATMWPPNHKLHRFSIAECAQVSDACDDAVDVQFTYVASDEPINARGDGNTDPDVRLGCDAVELRAERQGGGDGRVYTLGVRATDAAGNVTDGSCTVTVAHDQGAHGAAASSATAYRIDAPASCSAP